VACLVVPRRSRRERERERVVGAIDVAEIVRFAEA
jgi:hypothetical protein